MKDIESVVSQIKSKGLRVFKAKIAGVDTVYRSISRSEFRTLQKALAAKTESLRKLEDGGETQIAMLKDDGEERLVLLSLVSPHLEGEIDLASLPAGFIPTVAELVMTASGFNESVEPEEL